MKDHENDLVISDPFSNEERSGKNRRRMLRFEYQGKEYSLKDLEKLSGLPRRTLENRLRRGWDVRRAVETPRLKPYMPKAPREDPLNVLICFEQSIPGIFPAMQPELNTPYLAKKGIYLNRKVNSRNYYIIQLESGKPLIVYENECKILADSNTSRADRVYAVEPLSWLPGKANIYYWDLNHLSDVSGPRKIYHRKDGSAYVQFENKNFNIDESRMDERQYVGQLK